MDHLPIELIQRIFTLLDLATLRNTALSGRIFLNAFTNADVLITSEIVLREIGLDVLPEAVLVHESWNLGAPSIAKAIAFAEAHLTVRAPSPSRWRLADALPLGRFHRFVDYFANEFAAEALAKMPTGVAQAEPSRAEIHRFQRAFYRFQLYCNVVGRNTAESEEFKDMFFGYFAAWENEQLACVNDYLMRVVAKPYNYFVDHDINWGWMTVRYIDRHHDDYGQYILFEGLEKCYRLSKGSNYQEWNALFEEVLEGLHGEDGEFPWGEPFYQDADGMPRAVWEWAYKENTPDSLVGDSRMRQHRQWAFTFWDSARLERAGLYLGYDYDRLSIETELELAEYSTAERTSTGSTRPVLEVQDRGRVAVDEDFDDLLAPRDDVRVAQDEAGPRQNAESEPLGTEAHAIEEFNFFAGLVRDIVGAGSVPDLGGDNGLDMDLLTPTCIASTTHRIMHKKTDASGVFYTQNRSPLLAGGLIESLHRMGKEARIGPLKEWR
ncbi:hypothetical protein PG988_013627 [Apiospora saccharicola]